MDSYMPRRWRRISGRSAGVAGRMGRLRLIFVALRNFRDGWGPVTSVSANRNDRGIFPVNKKKAELSLGRARIPRLPAGQTLLLRGLWRYLLPESSFASFILADSSFF